jgi:hypothetical protein
MTKNNHWFYSFIIVLLSFWLGWTILVDFFVVPSIFREIPEFFKAGKLGMILFSKLNNLELIVSSSILGLSIMQSRKNPHSRPLIPFALLAWMIIMLYFTFLTPKIIILTEMWMKAGHDHAMFVSQGITDIQQEHHFYHNLYRSIDAIKLVLLTIFLFCTLKNRDKWA